MSAFQLPIAANNDILSWTNQDPRESILFNAWGVVYRFTTTTAPNGQSVTTLYRQVRPQKEERVAKLEWAPNGGLGRATLGKNILPMLDIVQQGNQGERTFIGPDGKPYAWRPNPSSQEVLLQDSKGETIAFFRPTRPTRYQIGDVYGELHFLRTAGLATVMHPPMMDLVTLSAMLYRFCVTWGV